MGYFVTAFVAVCIGVVIFVGPGQDQSAAKAANKSGPTYPPFANTHIMSMSRNWTDLGDYNYIKTVRIRVQGHAATCLLVWNGVGQGYGESTSFTCPTALNP